ncbi:nickel pincer cofactor biosynthesis protein LarB [Chitinispirillales bacterium ANBcel5]|uniref:nickel pincer cofactor biosynthesis protein LarB n=1 Tax=Cellulosispirillum alkaliphilum TaxID=3039283 RepID=UPI002A4F748E|nr:nickel pincer cofactor biosynthesis protein LarB [Chitinispirillales bacterium ANBcel5]
MDSGKIAALLKSVYEREIEPGEAMESLKDLPFKDMGFACIDHHRVLRKGFPEVIFCQNKTPEQVVSIAVSQISQEETVFGTRASKDTLDQVEKNIPGAEIDREASLFWRKSRFWEPKENTKGTVLVCSAGTADSAVARETVRTLDILGHPSEELFDVGVAGIHRLLARRELLLQASVIIVVAGMEGALASVVTGLVACPVIGVPTSVGYGSHLNGLVPLFSMLNCCSSGLTVVNVDNGFGAACAAAAMNTK